MIKTNRAAATLLPLLAFAASAHAGDHFSDILCYGVGEHVGEFAAPFDITSNTTEGYSIEGRTLVGPLAGPGFRFGDRTTTAPLNNSLGVPGRFVAIAFDEPVPAESLAIIVDDLEGGSVTIGATGPGGEIDLVLYQESLFDSTCVHTLTGSVLSVGGCTNDTGPRAVVTGVPGQLVSAALVVSSAPGDYVAMGFGYINPCPIDFDASGLLDLADITAFSQSMLGLTWQADLTGPDGLGHPDGLHDLADIVAFVELFLADCE